jgi:probable HAF family extracellular repeat protein
MRGRTLTKAAAVAIVLCVGLLTQTAGAAYYTLTDLTDAGLVYCQAFAISSDGRATGELRTDAHYEQAFHWDGSSMTDLGVLGTGYRSWGLGVNASGAVAGWSAYDASGDHHAFLHNGTTMTDLHALAGFAGRRSEATGINDAGQVCGWANVNSGNSPQRAFVYDGSSFQVLGTIDPGEWYYSVARDINSAGHVAGYSDSDSGCQAFLYDGAAMQGLGTLGGSQSVGYALNDSDHVVGYAYDASSNQRAFYHDGTTMYDLGTLGGPHSVAYGMNDGHDVVGSAYDAGMTGYGVLWQGNPSSGWTITKLNDLINPALGWNLRYGYGINDAGQIVGYGTASDGYTHGFILTPQSEPVPEPVSIVFFGTGVAGVLGFAARRRMRKGA